MSASRNRDIVMIDPVNDVAFSLISGDPTTGSGLRAGVGSIGIRTDAPGAGPGGAQYTKVGKLDTDWAHVIAGVPALNPTLQTASAELDIDFATGDTQRVLLADSAPALTLVNLIPGRRYALELTQDSTGSRAPTFSPALIGPVTLSTSPGKRDIVHLYVDALGTVIVTGTTIGL